MKDFLTRRAFLSRVSLFALGWQPVLRTLGGAPPAVLRVGILDGADADRLDGALLGAEEARHAASLFGGEVQLTKVSEGAASAYRILLGDADADRCSRLARAALLMNVASVSDDLRGAQCSSMLFHVAPSHTMRRDAARLARVDADATAWDSSLVRFGADTLNQRFRSRFGRPMTEVAWISWMAMKVLWESSLRAKSTEPGAIAAFLSRDTTQFDGHKGRPLSFRAWDRQLRQPLYARSAERVIELPSDANTAESPKASLDRLGVRESDSQCKAAP